MKNKISYIDTCNTCISETRNSLKLGHNLACHYNYTCTSNILFLKSLGTHFPSIRSITNILYRMQRAQNLITEIDHAIYTSDLNKLIEIRDQQKLTGTVFNVGIFIYTNENNIISTHSQSFVKFNTRVTDKPINVCMSCHKLCFRRDVVENKNIRKPIINN